VTEPTVSVCIPTYNGAAYIERTIRSVLAQSWADFELVVCDDSSTDGTLDLVRGVSDPRLRVVAGDRVGPGANFQRAASEARGMYVKLLCQDDVLYPQCLEHQVAAIEGGARSGVVLVACRRDIVDDDDRILMHARGWHGAAGVVSGDVARRAIVRAGTNLIGEPSAVLCSRVAFERAGGFDPALAYLIDLDAWMRVLDGAALVYLPEALCTFRVSQQSWSAELRRSQAREMRALLVDLRRRYPETITRTDLAVGWSKPTLLSFARRAVFAAPAWLSARRPTVAETDRVESADVP
jgi:glycosyltransferase involved in cell wall biosynthesis